MRMSDQQVLPLQYFNIFLFFVPKVLIEKPAHNDPSPWAEALALVPTQSEETGFSRKFTTFSRKIPKLPAKTARAFAGPAEAFIIPPRRL